MLLCVWWPKPKLSKKLLFLAGFQWKIIPIHSIEFVLKSFSALIELESQKHHQQKTFKTSFSFLFSSEEILSRRNQTAKSILTTVGEKVCTEDDFEILTLLSLLRSFGHRRSVFKMCASSVVFREPDIIIFDMFKYFVRFISVLCCVCRISCGWSPADCRWEAIGERLCISIWIWAQALVCGADGGEGPQRLTETSNMIHPKDKMHHLC